MRITFLTLFTAATLSGCLSLPEDSEKGPVQVQEVQEAISDPTNQVKLRSAINWEQLNPARGDQSPKAGTVWGDRKGSVATGFLAEFVDGFSSPPHIHNVSYRAVVISGLVHNDDEAAAKMWMSPGSFWTQPAGEAHITAVKGSKNVAYVEIDSGPYLVKPIAEAFDNGERPINMDASNVVWLKDAEHGVERSYLWGSPDSDEMHGLFIKLPPGYDGMFTSHGSTLRAIIVTGSPAYTLPNSKDAQVLEPGSSFSSEGRSLHYIAAEEETVIYVRTDGVVEF